jgi:RNA polymerase sigma-70 factor (ECF subfamily)
MPDKPTEADDWVAVALAEHEGPLLRYALRLTGNVERARDVVQETFLRLCAEQPAELDGHLRAWLFRVCRHRAVDQLRKERPMASWDPVAESACEAIEPPQQRLEADETADLAQRLVAELPARQQEVVRLKFQSGLSYREIAEVTGLTVSHVGVLLHTAIKSLRTQLTQPTGARPQQGGR